MKTKTYLSFFLVLSVMISSFQEGFTLTDPIEDKGDGIIKCKVIDDETQNNIENVIIKIIGSDYKGTSNSKGEFIFDNLRYGTYQLEVSMIGYKPHVKTDIVVISDKPIDVLIELVPVDITTGTIDVEANYFQKSSDENTSVTVFDYEEIRRAPGAAEDISRMMQSAPGVSIGTDQRNDLIVRGGSPFENLILIDGIEVPNISHFGSQTTTGGAIGFINLKLLRDAKIYTGGFPSKFGDRLSSVVDIRFREGSKKRHYFDLDFNNAGFGGVIEGPITGRSSYLLSVRRSYLDLLKHMIRLPTAPNYWDINLKLNYDLNQNNKIGVIGVSSLDKLNYRYSEANGIDDQPGNSDLDNKVLTIGANYMRTFKKGFVRIAVSDSYSDYLVDGYSADYTNHEFHFKSSENETVLSSELSYKINSVLNFNFGVGAKHGTLKDNIYSIADTTPQGYQIPGLSLDNEISTNKLNANLTFTGRFFENKLVLNFGGRYDYFDYIRLKNTFSPRAGLTFNLTSNTSVNASYGIYHQTPASLWLVTEPNNKNLNSIRCDHYILGAEHFFTPEIRGTVEIYEKRYKDYPVSSDEPTYILIDGGARFEPSLVGKAVSIGRGYVRGVDISLEKKLSGNGIYGMINYSYTKSGFTALTGGEKPAAFDPTNQLTVIAGYQVADDWLIGLKFKYAGGRPYTPFDAKKSIQSGRGVYDMSRFNELRYPDYHRLDVRVDKKFYLGSRFTFTTYVELQNIYNRQNVFEYFWNESKNSVGTEWNWSFLPVGGFSLQF